MDSDVYAFYSTSARCGTYDRTLIARNAFTGIAPIPAPESVPIPGDYAVTKAGDIDAFMQRLRNSFVARTERLSDTGGPWLPDELRAGGWDAAAVDIPGLTAGFPDGVDACPTDLPAIPD